MKRYYLYLLSILVLVGCSEKQQDTITTNSVNYSPKFYAEIDNTMTRTYVNDALEVCWSEKDKLSVFTSTANQLYQFDGNTGDLEGTFSVVEMNNSSTGSSLSVDANYAVYPYNEETTISSDGTLSFDLPQNQVYVPSSFGVNSNPMIAVTENKNDTYLSFKNICGYLRLSLYGDDITAKSIRLEGNSNEYISGSANVSISYGQEPVITLTDNASYAITLDCQDGVKIGESASSATEFWFVVPPVTFENGFTIIVEDINGNKYSKSTENKLEIKRNVISNMAASKVEQMLEYQLFEKEIDGIDGIITQDGAYALLKETPNNDAIVLTFGMFDEEDKDYMLIDGNGFIKAMSIENNELLSFLYTPDCVWIIDDNGRVIAEIPYDEFMLPENEPQTRATIITRNPIYQALSIRKIIKDFLKKPIKTGARKILENFLNGKLGRSGETVNNFIDAVFEVTDILNLLDLLDNLQEIEFFGNASLVTLPANIEDVVNVSLPCEIKNLSDKRPHYYAKQKYGDVVNYSYTLGMNVYENSSFISSIINTQSKTVRGNGIETFEFKADKLNHSYGYEPSLKIDITIEIDLEAACKAAIQDLPPGYQIPAGETKLSKKSCIIYGDKESFTIGSVNSAVEKIENEKSTSADVICSFSDVPSGAECQILITKEGTDISQIFSGQPDCKNQKVSVSGLTPSTTYIASSRIIYKGIPYNGSKSVSFSTSGPSGYLISIPEEQITTTSAIVKCQFSNVGSGVECGIIVKGEDGSSKTISASNVESEQEVTISGLSPATQYTCTSYVKLTHFQGSYYKEGNSLSFTTDLPDVTGTWTCKEKHYRNNGQEYYTTYTVTLHKDGTATTSKYDSIAGASWSQSKTGLSVRIDLIATQYSNTGYNLSIKFDDPTNPTSGKGYAEQWAYSGMTGGSSSYSYELEMTK